MYVCIGMNSQVVPSSQCSLNISTPKIGLGEGMEAENIRIADVNKNAHLKVHLHMCMFINLRSMHVRNDEIRAGCWDMPN